MIIEIDLTTANATPHRFIPVAGYDTVSVTAEMLQGGANFNTGVITVYKANTTESVAALDTPVTLTAPGTTPLVSSDWLPTKYLTFACTTAASSATRVLLTVQLDKIGYKL